MPCRRFLPSTCLFLLDQSWESNSTSPPHRRWTDSRWVLHGCGQPDLLPFPRGPECDLWLQSVTQWQRSGDRFQTQHHLWVDPKTHNITIKDNIDSWHFPFHIRRTRITSVYHYSTEIFSDQADGKANNNYIYMLICLSSQISLLLHFRPCPRTPTTFPSLFTVMWRVSTQRKCLCPGFKTAQSSLSPPPLSRTWMGPTEPDAIILWAPTRGSKVGWWSVQCTSLGWCSRSVAQCTWRNWIPKVRFESRRQ